MYNDVICT